MIKLSLQKLSQVLNAKLVGAQLTNKKIEITQVVIDNHQVTTGCLFVALKGKRFDGHDFATSAVAAGAIVLLVSRLLDNQLLLFNIPQLVVADTRIALGQLAAWLRQELPTRAIAITGSSGKTSVKEMVVAILYQYLINIKKDSTILYTIGNENNDIGVPLTLLRLMPEHEFAVIELGANHLGEIAYTTALSQPESVLVNNLAAAHLEGFGSFSAIAQAKGEIFTGLPSKGTAIINADSHDWLLWQQYLLHQQRIWRFSLDMKKNVDFFATDIRIQAQITYFILHSPQGATEIKLSLLGQHNITNALAAAALAMSVGADLLAISKGLAQSQAVTGRLSPIYLAAGKLLLDDSYNANVSSMIAAARTLADMPGYRVMVVGDIKELGDKAVDYHYQVGKVIQQLGIDKVLSIGELSQQISFASSNGEHFQDQHELTMHLVTLLLKHPIITILIKGSRSTAMEKIVHTLQEKYRVSLAS